MRKLGIWIYRGRTYDPVRVQTVLRCFRDSGLELYTLPEMASLVPDAAALAEEAFYSCVDAVAALGGDGTVLSAARGCAPHGIPVFGVNLGNMGFLAGTDFDGLSEAAARLRDGQYQTESRMMIEAHVLPDGPSAFAVNDVLICSSSPMTMIRTSASANTLDIGDFDCDGLLVSTPTGSTGYNLSAGGPVIGPGAEVMILTPLHAHSMRSVPLVLGPDSRLTLSYHGRGSGLLIADGREAAELNESTVISVSRAPYDALLIQMDPEQFYKVLYAKLK